MLSLGTALAYFGFKLSYNRLTNQDTGGACPLDHQNRDEMVKIA